MADLLKLLDRIRFIAKLVSWPTQKAHDIINHPAKTSLITVLHRYNIHGISLSAYDEADSMSADWVAWALLADDYRLQRMPFDEREIVVEIGAHIGLCALYLAKRWPGIAIYSFEPCPANFGNCIDYLTMNGVANVVLSPKAIANDNRLLNMKTNPQNTGGARAVYETSNAGAEVTGLATITLDEVFAMHQISRCKLLKIECEGMEYEILFGANILEKTEYLAGEFHTGSYLENLGWSPQRLPPVLLHNVFKRQMSIGFQTMAE